MNRLKGFDLVNSVPEELWSKVCNTVQEAANKTIPKEKKCKKAKGLSEEALQIAEERREAKSKMAIWGGLTNSCEKKGSEKQRRKEKIHPFECRVPKNSKESR